MSVDVREKHGVVMSGGEKQVTINERDNCVYVAVHDGIGSRFVYLTPNEARYVATKLRRTARRVDDRLPA